MLCAACFMGLQKLEKILNFGVQLTFSGLHIIILIG